MRKKYLKYKKWYELKNYEGLYLINKSGELLNIKTKNIIGITNSLNEKDYPSVYLVKNKKSKMIRIHRLMAETFLNPDKKYKNKKYQVDHIDNNRHNNNLDNLRLCNNSLNNANKKKNRKIKTTSKYLGVSYDKNNKKFRADICVNNKTINLGRFKKELDAAIMYDIIAKKFFKEFANLNFK